jgi:hypothetical protein
MCVRVVSGRVFVCYGSEWSCICVLGDLVVMYMCIRVVSGHVYVC